MNFLNIQNDDENSSNHFETEKKMSIQYLKNINHVSNNQKQQQAFVETTKLKQEQQQHYYNNKKLSFNYNNDNQLLLTKCLSLSCQNQNNLLKINNNKLNINKKHSKIYSNHKKFRTNLNQNNLTTLYTNANTNTNINTKNFLHYFNNINYNLNNFLMYFYIVIFLCGYQLSSVYCQIDINLNNNNQQLQQQQQQHQQLQQFHNNDQNEIKINVNKNDNENNYVNNRNLKNNEYYKYKTINNNDNSIDNDNHNNNVQYAEVSVINFGHINDTTNISKSSASSLLNNERIKLIVNNQNNSIDNIEKFLIKDYHDGFGLNHDPKLSPIYLNEFAVYVPAGELAADKIADKYGFVNMGQIGSLKHYYLFHHRHISKRSTRQSSSHHSALNSEPEVRWMQQQHEKIRKKRDYSTDIKFAGLSPLRLPSFVVDGSGAPSTADGGTIFYRSASPLSSPGSGAGIGFTGFGGGTAVGRQHSLLRGIAPQSRLQYRATSPHNIFPDPLFKEQWYLNGGAKDGLDMNVQPAWQKGYTGKGVVVSILDDGIQTNHPDLAQNYDPDASYDINGNDSDPTPQDNGDNKHGTRCAGEVAAVAFNNYCGVGVAYNASIGGVRMLDGSVNDAVEAKALSLNPQHIDIYSASWGPEDDGSTVDGPGPLARRAFIYGVTSGRQGKGSIFVWASGNGGRYTDSCNCDGYTNSIFTLSISSATQGGFKPWYLEECSSTLATTYSSGTPGHDKSVATVDMDGRLRPDHICTVEHTGTSASAPLAAGIAALALEANPSLTWRDMQYLVVMTSRHEPLEKESGWILNGVKRKFSHKFGYGLMDAGAMVSLAEQWKTVPPQHICKSRENNEDRQIDGSYGFTLSTHMDVNGCAGTINEVRYLEHVQCKITLRFFPRGNLRILLTSPMGTTSTLLYERPRDIVKSNFDDWPFLSVHFWGEKAEGRWTLQVINGGRRRVNQAGILAKWQLIFYGTSTNPVRLKDDGAEASSPFARVHQGVNPFVYPTDSDLRQPYINDQYSGYLNYQNLFVGAASNIEKTVATVDGHNIPTPQRQTVMADSNNKLVLHDCDPECDSQGCYGRGPTQCVACKHYRLDNTCVSRCPPRSFPNQGGVCWPCHESCETCAGAGQDSCLTCAPAHLHVTDLAVCLQVCPDGYYENTENKTCVPCESNCASCQDRPNYCMSCDHHLVMHEHKCYSACPVHTFETEDYNCASCHSSCETCNGSSESQCITCRSGRFSFDGKCLNKCTDGYYGDKKRQECMECPKGCATCISTGICLSCHENWNITKKGKCIANREGKCDDSEYYGNGICHPCHSTCETCDAPTERNCLTCQPSLLLQSNRCVSSCDDGYYMESGVCTKCLHTCTQCVSRMNCTACAKGLQLQSGECRTTCAEGYFSDRGTCAKCYLSCNTCSGPRRDQCVICPDGWQLAGGECHPECPEGFYKSEYGCQKCHHYCKTCNGAGPLACTSCPLHFMLDGGLCMECLGSQFYDPPTQTCKTCHESCRTCSGPGQYSCQNCAFPLHLDRLNNQCVPCCATDASPDDQSCCHCDKDTGGCINASPAGKRRIAAGAEQQFLSTGGLDGNNGGSIFSETGNSGSGGDGNNFLSRFGSPFTAITAIAVAACLLIVTIFAVIFAVLQRNSYSNGGYFRNNLDGSSPVYMGLRYNKFTGKSKKSHSNRNGDDDGDEDEKGYLLEETDDLQPLQTTPSPSESPAIITTTTSSSNCNLMGARPKTTSQNSGAVAKKIQIKLNDSLPLSSSSSSSSQIRRTSSGINNSTIDANSINNHKKVNSNNSNTADYYDQTTNRDICHRRYANNDYDDFNNNVDAQETNIDYDNSSNNTLNMEYHDSTGTSIISDYNTDIDQINNDGSAFNRKTDIYNLNQHHHHHGRHLAFNDNESSGSKNPSADILTTTKQRVHQMKNDDIAVRKHCSSELPKPIIANDNEYQGASSSSSSSSSNSAAQFGNFLNYENFATVAQKNVTTTATASSSTQSIDKIDDLEPIIRLTSTNQSKSIPNNKDGVKPSATGELKRQPSINSNNRAGHSRTKSMLSKDFNLNLRI